MAAINDLISQIEDKDLRERIERELNKFSKQKKFGLVFEDHLPECVPLYNTPIRRGSKIALKTGNLNDFYTVMQVEGDNIYCADKEEKQLVNFLKQDVVPVAEFGEPIYPYLQKIDSVYKSDDAELPAHALIQADNYHALQLLEYLYAGKVDCIYIDPPYNTGARDWKYNNDYVDSSDTYRHSKWLSMMKKRLLLAKKLLNPADSVMIVTIDEKEYLHLGCLLEELFPEARIQMVSSVINPAGVNRGGGFARTDEYLYFIMFGNAAPITLELNDDWRGKIKGGYKDKLRWNGLQRSGTAVYRTDRPNMFYPIFISKDGKKFAGVGDPIPLNVDRTTVETPKDVIAILPIFPDGREGRWRLGRETLLDLIEKHYVKIGGFRKEKTSITYLAEGEREKVENGDFPIKGYAEDGSVIVDETQYVAKFIPGSQWWIPSHDATQNGTKVLNQIIGPGRFSFPKSLYAVHDTIRFFVANKPNALIVDFFAGSGTTLHAVNLLNAEDGGKRQCVIVTNNEVSDDEAKALTAKGLNPGDAEWEKLGIANYVTWPRTVCSINGKDIKDEPLKGNYIGSDIPMADGFKANAVFFKLGFLDKNSVALGRQFKELLSLLWLKSGGFGKCPEPKDVSKDNLLPTYIIVPENKFAVLIDEKLFSEFEQKVNEQAEIQTVYIVTDFEKGFKSMSKTLKAKKVYQLYRDYLDNFRINIERN